MGTKEDLRDVGIEVLTVERLGHAGSRTIDELVVDGDYAAGTLRKLRDAFPKTGRWPIVWGPEAPLDQFLDTFKRTDSQIDGDIAEAARIDINQWFVGRRKAKGVSDPDAIGPWPTKFEPWRDGLALLKGSEVSVLFVPVAEPSHIPAVLGLGGFNDCPRPHELCALLEHWKRKYLAWPASLGSQANGCDTMELTVDRPPEDRPGAIALAKELFIVADYEMMMPADLAAQLVSRRTWLLWWD
jgi:hypothetical protein